MSANMTLTSNGDFKKWVSQLKYIRQWYSFYNENISFRQQVVAQMEYINAQQVVAQMD